MTVYLVGAGPGDPGLLTVRATDLIRQAEVIFYDRLIPAEAMADARPEAELVYVGKEGGGPSVSQDHIAELLVERGRSGALVVRLKGGDPFLFGRGGEEAQALRDAGVPFEVVPGVTAGVAVPAYAGIPLTHRGVASAVAFLTGHEDPGKEQEGLDWEALAAFPGTLVLYMGVRRLEAITRRLQDGGREPSEPAAVIERGTTSSQRVLSGTLESIARLGAEAGIVAPALTVIGPVAGLREELAWFEQRPLFGRTVGVMRARAQASELAARLSALGAYVVEAPAIRIVPVDGPLPDLARYELICLTSPNGAHLLFERIRRAGLDARALAGATVAAIGPGTAAALGEHGVAADIVPDRFVAEGLVDALAGLEVTRALVARAAQARDVLPDALRESGVDVDVVELYRTEAEALSDRQLEALAAADYLLFGSSSTVRFFLEAAGSHGVGRARVLSIGPVTSASLREHGIEPDLEAEPHDIDGLVAAVLQDALSGS